MIRSRYPDYDVMKESDEWDERTRAIIADRLKEPERPQWFTPPEAETLQAAAKIILGEKDPWLQRKVVELVDRRLASGEGDGYRPRFQPDDPDLWRAGLADLDGLGQAALQIQTARITALQGDDPVFFKALHQELLAAYCSLPPVWSFMGYGGPAYPRGYIRIELGQRDPWEAEEANSVPTLPPDGPPLPPGAKQVKRQVES